MNDVIRKSVNELATHIIISQAEMSTWRDGKSEYYKVVKDERPDAIDNVQELGDGGQTYWTLYKLAHEQAGLNGASEELKKQLAEIKELYELADAYASHVLAQLLDDYQKYEEKKHNGTQRPY